METCARFNHECPRTPGYKTHGSDKRGSFSLLITFQISQTSCFRRFLKSWVELSQLGSRFAVATSPAVVRRFISSRVADSPNFLFFPFHCYCSGYSCLNGAINPTHWRAEAHAEWSQRAFSKMNPNSNAY